MKFVAKKKGMTTIFFHSSLLLLFLDPGSEIGDPGSGMGKNQDPASGINIPDPQHRSNLCLTLKLGHVLVPVDGVVVHVTIDEELEGGGDALLATQLLPGGDHPLAQQGVVHPVPVVDQSGVLIQQPAVKVHGKPQA